MKRKLDPGTLVFMQFCRDNYDVKFIDSDTGQDLLDDSTDDDEQKSYRERRQKWQQKKAKFPYTPGNMK